MVGKVKEENLDTKEQAVFESVRPPDFNPIEEAFAKLKALVRKAEAR